MKKTVIFLPLFMLLSYLGIGQTHTMSHDQIRCTYETREGRLDGAYTSYYPNGQKKAEGTFDNNIRKGTWVVYDTTGQLRIRREYPEPFSYTQTMYRPTESSDQEIISSYTTPLVYNAFGYINHFKLEAKMVLWARRIWRFIPISENDILFKNHNLYQLLLDNIENGTLKAYSDEDYQHIDSARWDIPSYQVVGFRMVEDCVLDSVRMLLERRIVGLCPVVMNLQTRDTSDLFWVYFPHIRKILAYEKIEPNQLPHVKTLDDLFFFRVFHSRIYKEDNMWDRPISYFFTGQEAIAREAERIEISLIESEHDLWWNLPEK